MYIKKKDRELFKELDTYLDVPNDFYKFINQIYKSHNLIIKTNNDYYCTGCGSKINTDKKVNEYQYCCHCKQKLLIKSSRLKQYTFKTYNISIFDKYKKHYIERLYCLESIFSDGKFKRFCYEWGRNIYSSEFIHTHSILCENTVATISGTYISFKTNNPHSWRYDTSYYSPIRSFNCIKYYPLRLKEILKSDKRFKYSEIWELAKHTEFDVIYLLENYSDIIELLIKNKLYNLALVPKSLNNKNYYLKTIRLNLKFIQKYNLDLDELIILHKLNKPNIKLIRKIEKLNNYNALFEYVDFEKAFKLTDLDEQNCNEYYDYLDMARKMKLDINNKQILYPENIKNVHDKLLTEFKLKKNKLLSTKIKKISKKLENTKFTNNPYIIYPVTSYEELVEEGNNQHNCVRTYADRIVNGTCLIYLMRKKDNPNKSLVTVEVRNKKVVQSRIKNNESTTLEQKKFLKKFEVFINSQK